jgi:hypothetical protein
MYQLLFKNRFNTLVFVAILLFSVRILVGTDDERGMLQSATKELTTTPKAEAKPTKAAMPTEVITAEFTPDEDLIDDASGMDPSGWSGEPVYGDGPGLETAENEPQGWGG